MDQNNFNKYTSKIGIEGAIIKVVAFFDMFDCPLTDMEIWENLSIRCNFMDVRRLLESNEIDSIIGCKNGFYCLVGREEVYVARMERYNYAARKCKRAVLMAKIFKIVPWIKTIAVGNLIGANNLKDKSDIDLFIITEKNRVWLSRLFCVLITAALGMRPQTGNTRDKICLSFFAGEDGMELKGLMLGKTETPQPPFIKGGIRDYYFIYWLAGLAPVYDRGGTYAKLIEANKWIYEALPNWRMKKLSHNRDAGKPWSFLKKTAVTHPGSTGRPSQEGIFTAPGALSFKSRRQVRGYYFNRAEKIVMAWQIKRLPAQLKEMMNKDTRVVINEKMIKTHANDRREEYLERYEQTIGRIR